VASPETVEAVLALSVLPPAELKELLQCEAIIAQGWQSFIETGRALAQIRDRKLYRAQYDTFEAYCRAKWQYGKSHTCRLIGAAELLTHLSPIVDMPTPSHEAQVRPLIGVPVDQAQSAWKKALAKANGKAVTAKLVKEALVEVLGPSTTKPARENQPMGFSVRHLAPTLAKALCLLKQIETSVSEGAESRSILCLLAELKQSLRELKQGANGSTCPAPGTQREAKRSSPKA
jgi:hypothetical protein